MWETNNAHASHFDFISGSIPIAILVKQDPGRLGILRRGKVFGDVLQKQVIYPRLRK